MRHLSSEHVPHSDRSISCHSPAAEHARLIVPLYPRPHSRTCVAPPRMLIAFLENHLQKDGSVTIPEVLWPYMGGTQVLVPKK